MPETIGDRLVRGDKGRFLDGLGDAVSVVNQTFYKIPGTRPIKDLLHGTLLLRHPFHPMVTDAVVGAFTVVALLDVVYLIQRDPSLFRATDIALVLGLVAALGAVLSGFTDWNETYENERRLGILHGILMSLITIGYLVSLWLRLAGGSGARDGAIWLALVMWVALAVTAYLGGEMAFGFGTGVNRQAFESPPKKWQRTDVSAAGLEDRKPMRVEVEGFAAMLVKLDGAVHAIGAVCTHAGCDLAEGEFVGGQRRDIKCPCHASVFSIATGTALHGPATMDEPVLDTRIAADGHIEVCARG
jgi:nitrite reductase/ring-hydroxylating ferredoxin subunit/uncharacterized membrane protein